MGFTLPSLSVISPIRVIPFYTNFEKRKVLVIFKLYQKQVFIMSRLMRHCCFVQSNCQFFITSVHKVLGDFNIRVSHH